MGSYSVEIKPSVAKDLRAVPKPSVGRILETIEGLRSKPLPRSAVKLSGAERLYRIRVGEYRIVYEVRAQVRQVIVHHIRHRRDVYRKL